MVRIATFALCASATVAALSHPLLRNFNVLDLVKKLDPSHAGSTKSLHDEWVVQKLDHNDPANTKAWKQRYFANTEYYGGPGSPVFAYINGENVASGDTITSPSVFINALAKKHKALLVTLEHRYYGKSQPVPDFTAANLKYLTVDQSLKDHITFQDHVAAKYNLTADSKWVAFGGSYPGMVAAWLKHEQPSRWAGSVASSAPVLAKADFFEYADKVAFGLQYYGKDKCVNTIHEGLVAFDALVASTKPEDLAELKQLFNPCTPLKNDFDRMLLESNIYLLFQAAAQGNDYPDYNLKYVCDFFGAPSNKTAVEKLADFSHLFFNCIESDYVESWIKPLNNTAVSETDVGRQWIYQTCAEFGYGQTTTTANSIFSALRYPNADKVLYELCRQAYGLSKAQTDAGIASVNQKYNALAINVENVIFPNGNIDPWSALGLTNATGVVNPKSQVIYIDGTSHCRDLLTPAPTDSPSLAWAHGQIETAVDGFLRNKC